MNQRTLDSLTPRPVGFDWLSLLRWFVMGPLTGACVGFVQTTAAVFCWIRYGQPDFYFRGWSGVDPTYQTFTVGGGLVGIVYGVVLLIFERWSHRCVRLLIVVPAIILVSFAAALLIAEHELQRQRIVSVFMPQLIAVGFGLLLSVVSARRAS